MTMGIIIGATTKAAKAAAKTKVRVKKDRVVVSMLKVFEKAYWESVSVNRRAVGPVRKSPPDHGRATTIYGSGAKK